jgi:hypothetical protein
MIDVLLFTDTRNQLHCHYAVPNTFLNKTLSVPSSLKETKRVYRRVPIGKAEVEGVKCLL